MFTIAGLFAGELGLLEGLGLDSDNFGFVFELHVVFLFNGVSIFQMVIKA